MILYESVHDNQFLKFWVPMLPIFANLLYYIVERSSFVLISHPIISMFPSLPLKLRLSMDIRRYAVLEIRQGNYVTGLVHRQDYNIQF